MILVIARAENYPPAALRELLMAKITKLNDTTVPFRHIQQPVIWDENRRPGSVTKIKAWQYYSDQKDPPSDSSIDIAANDEIQLKFDIYDEDLDARATFDREVLNSFEISITICLQWREHRRWRLKSMSRRIIR